MALVSFDQLMAHPAEALETLVSSSTEKYNLPQFRNACSMGDSSHPLSYLYYSLDNNLEINMNYVLLEACGFCGPDRMRMTHFKEFLITHVIEYEESVIDHENVTIYLTPDNFNTAVFMLIDERSWGIRRFLLTYNRITYKYRMYETLFALKSVAGVRDELDVARVALHQEIERNEALMEDLETVTEELQAVTKNSTKQPEERRLQSMAVMYLIKQVYEDGEDHQDSQNGVDKYTIYYTKCQRGRLPEVFEKLRRRYPHAEVTEFFVFDCEANGSHLFLRVKKMLKRHRVGVKVKWSTIQLGESVSPADFCMMVNQVHAEREEPFNQAMRMLETRHAQRQRALTRRE